MNFNKMIAATMAFVIAGGTAPAVYHNAPVSFMTASAADTDYEQVTSGGIIFNVFKNQAVVAGCTESLSGDVVIPSEINGVAVTAIDDEAFKENTRITSVYIPDSVTFIGEYAFYKCSELVSARLSEGLTEADLDSFAQCVKLTEVNLPKSLHIIGNGMFQQCESLSEITIPYTVEKIGFSAFERCTSLKQIEIPSSVTYLDSFAFSYSGIESIVLSENIEGISNYAFSECADLETVVIPDTIQEVGNSILAGTKWMENQKKNGPLVMLHGFVLDGADCKGDVILPDTAKVICDSAFSINQDMTSIVIPESVEAINRCAFSSCASLEKITILNPECTIFNRNDTFTGTYDRTRPLNYFDGTFYGYTDSTIRKYCDRYTRCFVALDSDYTVTTTGIVTVATTTAKTTTATAKTTTEESTKHYTAPEETTTATTTAANTTTTTTTAKTTAATTTTKAADSKTTTSTTKTAASITDGEKTEPTEFTTENGITYALYEDHAAVNSYDETVSGDIVLPSEVKGLPVTEIGKNAFESNSLITSVVIPDSVKIIGASAFQNCTALESAVIPDVLDKWDTNTFARCSSLSSVNIPTGVSELPSSTFAMTALTSVKVPENIKKIGRSVFEGCSSLKEATIPSTIETISAFTFAYSGLTSFTVPDSVTKIDSYAFSGCHELETFNVPKGINNFGQNILNRSLWLQNRQEEAPLVMINESVIDGTLCEGDVVLPDGTVGVFGIAFRDNKGMTSVTLPASVKEISYCAFSNCEALESVTFLNPECKIYDTSDTITNSVDPETGSAVFTGTIYGYEGSTAQTFAEKYNFKFEVLSCDPPATTTSATTTTTTTTTSTTTTSATTKKTTTTTAEETTTTTTSTTSAVETTTTTASSTKKTTTTTNETTTTATDETTTTTTTTVIENIEDEVIGVWDIIKSVSIDSGEVFDVVAETTATFTFTDDGKCVYYVNNPSQDQTQTIEYTWTADAGENKVVISNENDEVVFNFDLSTKTIAFIDPPENARYSFILNKKADEDVQLGDVNGDGIINAVDASRILVLYAALTANEAEITENDFAVCDINGDNIINAVDASLVLSFYANLAGDPELTLDAFLANIKK